MESTLYTEAHAALDALSRSNQTYAKNYPGDPPDRQPIHVVYGGAQLFRAETARRLADFALDSLKAYAPDAFTFARALGLPGIEEVTEAEESVYARRYTSDPESVRADSMPAWLALTVYARVKRKLLTEAVEDFRIDFEDGFGNRPDPEEDEAAIRAAKEVGRGLAEGILPPFIGIRIKPLNDELKRRSVRTLDLFISTLAKEAPEWPATFVVTLPKIQVPEQVAALAQLFEILEKRLGLPEKTLKMELMIELTQSIVDHDGQVILPRLLREADGRCVAAHFGTYDYTASCNITAAYQTMDHPACDFALHMMKNAFGGTGIFLSDGATNVMPVGPHRAPEGGELTEAQQRANTAAVHNAWRLAYGHIRHSLKNGFYQGWDLHPAQLPVRYAACYAFFLEGFAPAAERLSNFIQKAAQATLVGDVFDDAATGQGLLNYFLRGLNSGAVSLEELSSTGLTHEEIQTRSFVKILEGRSKA